MVEPDSPRPRRDRAILVAAAFVRAAAVGFVAVVFGLHLAARGFDAAEVSVVVGAGLGGAAAAALAVTVLGDRLSPRTWLWSTSALAAVGGAAVAWLEQPALVVAAAFVGMVNGMGRDRGVATIVEHAALPATTDDAGRTRTFAIYSLAQDVGHGAGALAAGLPSLVGGALGTPPPIQLEAAMWAHAAVWLVLALGYRALSPALAARAPRQSLVLRPESRTIVSRISALFLLDALGGGFLSGTLVTVFLVDRFAVGAGTVAVLFAAARVLNALSHLGAAWLARRIGLVRTMVFTHLPSSLLLITVAIAPSFPVAAVLFLLREGLVEMDVPTRSSYVMAVVAPDERTRVAGITQLVRLLGWAAGPLLAGAIAGDRLAIALIVGAGLKMTYDVLLYLAFRQVRPPEER